MSRIDSGIAEAIECELSHLAIPIKESYDVNIEKEGKKNTLYLRENSKRLPKRIGIQSLSHSLISSP